MFERGETEGEEGPYVKFEGSQTAKKELEMASSPVDDLKDY